LCPSDFSGFFVDHERQLTLRTRPKTAATGSILSWDVTASNVYYCP